MAKMNAAEIYSITVDQRSINQLLRDDGGLEGDFETFWGKVGFPYQDGNSQEVALSIIIQNAAAKIIAPTPLMERADLFGIREMLKRQGFMAVDIDKLFEVTGLSGESMTIGSFITRLAKIALQKPNPTVNPLQPFSLMMDRDDFRGWLARQLSESGADTVLERIGWTPDHEGKKLASVLTRMAKAILHPDVIQG